MRLPGNAASRRTFFYVVSQVIALGLVLYLMHNFTQRMLRQDTQTYTRELKAELIEDYRLGGQKALQQQIEAKLSQVANRDVVLLLKNPQGAVVLGNLTNWPVTISDHEAWRTIELYRANATAPEPIGVQTGRLSDGSVLLTGEVLADEARLNAASLRALAIALPVGLALALLNVWLARRLLDNRAQSFARIAHAFREGDLSQRIDKSAWGGNFDALAVEVNGLLDHNQRLIGELRMIADALAHDLRSPVTRMKANLEQAMSKTRDALALAALDGAIEEADLLQSMLGTALEISRAEAGIGVDHFSRFSLSEMLENIAEVYGPLAEDTGFAITVDVPEGIQVLAHRELLMRTISNLIDNALKYAAGGTSIQLSAALVDQNMVQLIVADDGPGIPPERLDEAMRRFGRLDAARTKSGAGLGLSLVHTITGLHGGTMTVSKNAPHGLRIMLQMPIGQPA